MPLAFNENYVSWKGTGVNSNPVGSVPGHIRPLTNNDINNCDITGFGLARPIKHFRKGRSAQANRFVKSSKGTSLGGGSGLLSDMQDRPGAFVVTLNPEDETDGVSQMNNKCATYNSIGIVAGYYPNNTFLQENPSSATQTPGFCCNDEKKARRRSRYASTNISKTYYTTTNQYLQNRCRTFDQKSFNFLSSQPSAGENPDTYYPYHITITSEDTAKPGSPQSLSNMYLANCQPIVGLYNSTQNSLIEQMAAIMFAQNLLNSVDLDTLKNSGINTISRFYNWLMTFSAPQQGDLLAIFNDYVTNPYYGMPAYGPSNSSGCQMVAYKPKNFQYAKQGAVDSSTRYLNLKVNTISTNAASIQHNMNMGDKLANANEISSGVTPDVANLMKHKAPGCSTGLPLNFRQTGPFQNKTVCSNLPFSSFYYSR